MLQNTFDDKSTSYQAMAWCRQAYITGRIISKPRLLMPGSVPHQIVSNHIIDNPMCAKATIAFYG